MRRTMLLVLLATGTLSSPICGEAPKKQRRWGTRVPYLAGRVRKKIRDRKPLVTGKRCKECAEEIHQFIQRRPYRECAQHIHTFLERMYYEYCYKPPEVVVPYWSMPKVTLVERECAITVPRLEVQEKHVGYGQELTVDYKEERRKVVVWVLRPRTIEKEVCVKDVIPTEVVDPCTGKCSTVYKFYPVMRKVKMTIYERVPETQEVIVKVPTVKMGEGFAVKKAVVYPYTLPAVKKTLDAAVMPNRIPGPLPPPVECHKHRHLGPHHNCSPRLSPPAPPRYPSSLFAHKRYQKKGCCCGK